MTAKTKKLLYIRAYARAWKKEITGIFTQFNTSFFVSRFRTPLLSVVTPNCSLKRYTSIAKNDGSFSTKQRVVFYKTTYRFQQNNVSFSTKQRVVCKSSTPFSFLTLRTTKSFFRQLFGGLTRHKSKQMFTNTYNKQNINLLYWTLWHLWQQKYKNFYYVCAHIRARGGK